MSEIRVKELCDLYCDFIKEYECMIIICLIFFVSILLFILSLINNAKTHKYKGRVEGEIVSIYQTISYGNNMKIYSYYPIYKYIVNGTIYQKEFTFGEKSEDDIPIGSKVILKYDMKEPEKFIVSGKENVWLGQAIILLIIAFIMLAMILSKCLSN